MSLYSIAAASLTTSDDRTRHAAVGAGQILRTLAFCLLAAFTLALIHLHAHPAGRFVPLNAASEAAPAQ